MGRVVHFEIHGDDPERAAEFYRGVFGWEISKWDGPVDYWLVTTGEDSEPGVASAVAAGATVFALPLHIPLPPSPVYVLRDTVPTLADLTAVLA